MDRFSGRNQKLVVGTLIVTIAAAVVIPLVVARNLDENAGVQGAAGEIFNTPTPSPSGGGSQAVAAEVDAEIQEEDSIQAPGQVGPLNCTFPLEYWKARPDAWPIEGLRIGSLALEKAEALAVLSEVPLDGRRALIQQLVVYALNIHRGADPGAVLQAVNEISDWIERYGILDVVPGPALARAQDLASVLLQFNMGRLGPGICPDITDTPTPPPSPTPTATASPSPTATQTNTAPPPPPVIPTVPSGQTPVNPPPTQPPPPTAPPTEPPPPTAVPTQPPAPPTSPPTTVPPTQPPPTPVPPDPPTPTSPA